MRKTFRECSIGLHDWIPRDRINWSGLCANPHDGAMLLLKQHYDEIDWYELSSNPHPQAMKWLLENPSRINWDSLSSNSNTQAIKFKI